MSEVEFERGMKRARLEAEAMRDIRNRTEWLTAQEIARRADLGSADPIEVVDHWKQQGRLFALRQDGQDYIPKYALGPDFQPLPVIKQILIVLAGYEPELLAGWFSSTSRFLDGLRPLELVEMQPQRVVDAARNLVDVQQNHG